MPGLEEKLADLIAEAKCKSTVIFNCEKELTYKESLEVEADHLIAGGVVVQEWIPVSERLPEQPGVFLVFTKAGNQSVQWFHMLDKKWPVETYEDTLRYFGDVSQHEKVTHWMPLPEPPKTE